jgi:hypothetical protein
MSLAVIAVFVVIGYLIYKDQRKCKGVSPAPKRTVSSPPPSDEEPQQRLYYARPKSQSSGSTSAYKPAWR